MPARSLKPCATPGCRELVRGSAHCPRHQVLADQRRTEHMKKVHAAYNQRRDVSDRFYKSKAWQACRAQFKRAHPLCEECEQRGKVVEMDIVDHRVPFKEAPHLALDWSNLRSLCRGCHNRVGRRVGLTGGQGGGEKL